MRDRKIILLLILIMTTVSLTVAGTAITVLYQTAMAEERASLVETALDYFLRSVGRVVVHDENILEAPEERR